MGRDMELILAELEQLREENLKLRKALEKIEEKSGYDDKGNLMLDYERIFFVANEALKREF